MSFESGEGRPSSMLSATAPERENLPCPRCNSTNTKFCYYNNYNLSQPRHFCKSCRRYWTRGGTLRNVPIGGGSRKPSANKRLRTAVSAAASSDTHPHTAAGHMEPEVNLNEAVPENPTGSFTSLLCGGGFMFGEAGGMHGFGFGLGMGDPLGGAVSGQVNGGGSAVSSYGCNSWQMGGGVVESSIGEGGDYFGWPDLAISAPGRRSA